MVSVAVLLSALMRVSQHEQRLPHLMNKERAYLRNISLSARLSLSTGSTKKTAAIIQLKEATARPTVESISPCASNCKPSIQHAIVHAAPNPAS
jgi:hypothetical protein